MKTYTIEIIETLSRVVKIEAESGQEAIDLVEQGYKSEEIILTADNADVETKFESCSEI